MTVAIVAGLAFLVLTIAYRAASGKRAGGTASGSSVDLQSLYPGSGPIAQARVPPGSHVVSVAPWGERLVLVVEDFNGSSVLVLDPKTARIEPLARLQPAP